MLIHWRRANLKGTHFCQLPDGRLIKTVGHAYDFGGPLSGPKAVGAWVNDGQPNFLYIRFTQPVQLNGACSLPFGMAVTIDGVPATISATVQQDDNRTLRLTISPAMDPGDEVVWTYAEGTPACIQAQSRSLLYRPPDLIQDGWTIPSFKSADFDGPSTMDNAFVHWVSDEYVDGFEFTVRGNCTALSGPNPSARIRAGNDTATQIVINSTGLFSGQIVHDDAGINRVRLISVGSLNDNNLTFDDLFIIPVTDPGIGDQGPLTARNDLMLAGNFFLLETGGTDKFLLEDDVDQSSGIKTEDAT